MQCFWSSTVIYINIYQIQSSSQSIVNLCINHHFDNFWIGKNRMSLLSVFTVYRSEHVLAIAEMRRPGARLGN